MTDTLYNKNNTFLYNFLILQNRDKLIIKNWYEGNHIIHENGIMTLTDTAFFVIRLFHSTTLFFTTSPTKALQFLNESFIQESDVF